MTSNRSGSSTTLAASASISSESHRTSGYSAARSATTSSQNGIVCTIPLLLVAEVR